MPPRVTPPPKGSFYPPNDSATHRDLLLFEERLKTNAAILKRRKHRYQIFLAQLLAIIVFLLGEVLLQTNFLTVPYALFLQSVLPDIYDPSTPVQLHPYFASGLLFVSVTTLVLFFASGMYAEKIGYANRYVPHANKALRSFNMYLNVRQPPLRSKYPLKALLKPFSFLSSSSSPPTSPTSSRRSPSPGSSDPPSARSPSTARPITSIPPTLNPRGELIFSSRVAPQFRESYERYRAAFERKRAERTQAAYARTWRGSVLGVFKRAGRVMGLGEREAPVVVSLPPTRAPSTVQRSGAQGTVSRRPSPGPGQGQVRGRMPRESVRRATPPSQSSPLARGPSGSRSPETEKESGQQM